jgi:uncharacterized cupin superfamily protein
MPKLIVIAAAAAANLEPGPVVHDEVLNGTPRMRSKELARSHDGTSHTMVWECTAGCFNWDYHKDETFVVMSGEAFITTETGEERRIVPGDIVFFPAGTSAKWRVPHHIKKVAFLRHTMPRPLGFAVLAWNRLLRIREWSLKWANRTPVLALTALLD